VLNAQYITCFGVFQFFCWCFWVYASSIVVGEYIFIDILTKRYCIVSSVSLISLELSYQQRFI